LSKSEFEKPCIRISSAYLGGPDEVYRREQLEKKSKFIT